ncbi:MAG: hypothetical protein OEZ43_07730 [Gammaproteobacteria bacterium]|nr:hypothetical protein [Gammaproteobacteria bacterium]
MTRMLINTLASAILIWVSGLQASLASNETQPTVAIGIGSRVVDIRYFISKTDVVSLGFSVFRNNWRTQNLTHNEIRTAVGYRKYFQHADIRSFVLIEGVYGMAFGEQFEKETSYGMYPGIGLERSVGGSLNLEGSVGADFWLDDSVGTVQVPAYRIGLSYLF